MRGERLMALTATESVTSATGSFGSASALSCRECGARYDLGPIFACIECFGPLEVAYDFGTVTRESIEQGPKNIWRYKALLPVPVDVEKLPNMNPGLTPLVKATGSPLNWGCAPCTSKTTPLTRRIRSRTGSWPWQWKLPGSSVSPPCPARRQGTLPGRWALPRPAPGSAPACSSRQAGGSQGRHGRGLRWPACGDRGTYDDVNRFCSELIGDPAGEDWGFVNVNLRPYYAEGSKTLAYEIAEQLGWRVPDQIVIPIASGSQLTKIDKGFQELIALGLVEDKPYRIFGAQATGCAPVARAWEKGYTVVQPVKPDTIAKSLAIGNPADGPYVLDVCRRTGGAVEHVSDEEIVDSIRLLARTEGIFAETAGGVTTGVLRKLLAKGVLDPRPRPWCSTPGTA